MFRQTACSQIINVNVTIIFVSNLYSATIPSHCQVHNLCRSVCICWKLVRC
uniref:Uncharacterized protein n=1 Tax=Arundo donax TaxID=35708 RepID=A0A0A9C557_ARUDO